ncbi:hypothetical protein D030_0662B, partial [Vibrio parahaemolyticus AQ3810]
VVTSSYSFARI